MDRYVIIMAGGSGTRFWPKSRRTLPKQLLSIFTGKTMVEDTLARATEIVPRENVFIVTTADQAALTRELLGDAIDPSNVIAEPFGRDTAPCIALACARVALAGDEASMLVMPADHVIRPVEEFVRVANAGFEAAETTDALVTFGVPPTGPATGYGYIAAGDVEREVGGITVREVSEFREKPDVETAKQFIEAGNYFWNAGIFVWKLSTMTAQLVRHSPDLAAAVPALREALAGDPSKELPPIYAKLEKISIDYAVMERADRVLVVGTTYEWNDVGSWTSLAELFEADDEGHIAQGDHVGIDCSNLIVFAGDNHLVATVGVKDLIIVHTDDATLVMNAAEAQRIKEVVERLHGEGREEVL